MLYRIFTEDCGRQEHILAVLDKHLDGYTVTKSQGYWQGAHEDSTIIEVVWPNFDGLDSITRNGQKRHILEIAEAIRQVNGQECVLVQRIANQQWFVTKGGG